MFEWRTELDEDTRNKLRSAAADGRTIVLWSPEECVATEELLKRLREVEERLS